MASAKIKKKSASGKAPVMPRQGAIPCLVIVVLALAVLAFLFFASFHAGG